MKKFFITLATFIIILAAVCFGCVIYLTAPAETYDSECYSFKVPKSFRLEEQEDDHKFTFNFLGEDIIITDEHLNCKPELISELFSDSYYADEKNRKLEKLEGYPYTGYFSSSEEDSSGKTKTNLNYMLGTDTHFLSADCYHCSSLKSKIIKKAMSKIAKSAEYTSDFRIADKPDVYDCEWFSVDTGSKYYLLDTTEDLQSSNENGLIWVREWYAEADSTDKMYSPSIGIKVEKSDDSPAGRADELYNKKLENKDKYPVLTRDKKNRFGFECEHFYSEYASGSSDSTIFSDIYFFRNDDELYAITATYNTGSDKTDAEEMLGGITIKNTDQ